MGMNGRSIVLGGGLAGLSAGLGFARQGSMPEVYEADSELGGLSKTVWRGEYGFDLGGHRFHTRDAEVGELVRSLMGDELITVDRKSRIYMGGRFFDYPLKPLNSISGLGLPTVMRIIADYAIERVRGVFDPVPGDSLEDWVVRNFGRRMFEIYFKVYSEKVWGIPCTRISRSWVEQRIRGLSLATALKSAFFKYFGRDIPTLADEFLYPKLGIGRLSDRIGEEVAKAGSVYTSSPVETVQHDGWKIGSITAGGQVVKGERFVSSIPLNTFVGLMKPAPPERVREAASMLGFRDLVIVAIPIDRPVVTELSWVYIPEPSIPFGRIHEPKVWSPEMAPEGKTLLVAEFFCFRGDDVWNSSDGRLIEETVNGLEALGFIRPEEAMDGWVLRVPKAYPLFEVGYEKHCGLILQYLRGFGNLQIAGRSGSFSYQNMDHAIRSGLDAASRSLGGQSR